MDRTTPTYCKILPIILGIILNSFVHLLFSKLCRNNLSSPRERGGRERGHEREGGGEGRRKDEGV